jgi:two-component system, cell cycle sensor histidine kinase and response regulator CckA
MSTVSDCNAVPNSAGGDSETANKNGRVLVMDDEEIMRDSIAALLGASGFEAICAADGREALDCIERERALGHASTAMILDLTIPGGAGGREIVVAIRRTDPNVPIIAASGYFDDPVMADPAAFGFSAGIAKPFSFGDLKALLAELLHKKLDP